MSITVLYFSSLREAAEKSSEPLPRPDSLPNLYAQLQAKYRFVLEREALRVAVNGHFVNWQTPVSDGDTVAFIPPVSGG